MSVKLRLDQGQMHLSFQQILFFGRPRNAHGYLGIMDLGLT